MLRNPNAPYERKRSTQILKLKTAYDEECMVVEHHKGKGQFENILGSLTCENHRGKFKIGSGFNLNERENPPPIGSTITYKYRGLTNSENLVLPLIGERKIRTAKTSKFLTALLCLITQL